MGILAPDEAQTHPKRNILTRAVGIAPEVEADAARSNLQEGDTLLLCSDGLHSLVGDEEIAQTMAAHAPQAACHLLVDKANALGGKDNITVIVARVDHLAEGAPRVSRRGDVGMAKTVEVHASRDARKGKPGARLLVTGLLLPFRLTFRVLRVILRIPWAALRLLFGR